MIGPVRRCRPEIFYGNVNLWRWLQDYLIHFSYTDYVHGKADELELILEDREQLWQHIPNPTKGAAILANLVCQDWNGPGQDISLRCGWFEIDEIEVSGPPSLVRIMAHSAYVTQGLTQTKKSRAWENITLQTPANDIATEHGLSLSYSVDYDPKFKRLDQTEQADLEFLHRECNKWDHYLKVAEGQLIIVSPSILEGQAGMGGFDRSEVSNYRITDKSRDVYRSCEVQYHDPKDKKTRRAEAVDPSIGAEGDTLEINERFEDQGQAQERAERELRRRNKYECEAEFSMMGRPDLVAGMPVPVSGFGQWSGTHFIEESNHAYSQSTGYVTSIRTRKGRVLNAVTQ